jgi:hypothetical protein
MKSAAAKVKDAINTYFSLTLDIFINLSTEISRSARLTSRKMVAYSAVEGNSGLGLRYSWQSPPFFG